jgi:hypothetical protein
MWFISKNVFFQLLRKVFLNFSISACQRPFMLKSMGDLKTAWIGLAQSLIHFFYKALFRRQIKGVAKKNPFGNFVFAISMLKQSRIKKILVCTLYNYGGIMGGRDKNF